MRTIVFISIFLLTLNTLSAQDILEWRGIDRTGTFTVKNVLKEWPKDGPDVVFVIDDLPKSYSSVIKKGNMLYTTGIEDEAECLTAINMDGQVLWNKEYGKAWTNSFSNARCTPTIEGNFAYMISGNGDIASVNIKDGSILWQVEGLKKFEGSHGSWGYAESPLLVEDKIIFTPGGDKTTMVALDKNTGETIWMSESLNDNSAYCSPVLIENDSLQLIVTVLANYVIGVNAKDGSIPWKFNYGDLERPKNGHDINPVTPLVQGNEIFVTSGYNHIGAMLEMSPDWKSVSLKWRTPALDVHHGGVVHHEGYLYGANFSNMIDGNWVCLDGNSGEVMYEHKWQGKGSIINYDDKLICYDARRGNIALAKAAPSGFDIISEFRIKEGSGPHWNHPTIYDDLLLIRHGNALMVFDLSY